MPTLYALLVAIDDYPTERNLDEAVSDLRKIDTFIGNHISGGFGYRARKLTNGDATKQKIINGFDHFRQAGDEDVCLFYFAGHGSTITNPPRELSHLENRQFQSLVCHDSRSSSFDLVDKELSYLIWEATGRRNFRNGGHFVAIIDACHSGDSTRDDEDQPLVRTVKPRMSKPIGDYYGYAQMRGNYPPRASHVLLSACEAHEKAGDGIFTPNLIKALNSGGRTYQELSRQLCNLISGRTRQPQNPQVWGYPSSLESMAFLGGAVRV
jgi:uncharacterized caspase-like protein